MLEAKRVSEIFDNCLFEDREEALKNGKEVQGIVMKIMMNPVRLEEHKEEIKTLLDELPDPFKQSKGGGWSFLKACVDKNNRQWGEHRNMEQLVCLGIGTGLVEYCMPKDMWNLFPGGVPYFSILDKEDRK